MSNVFATSKFQDFTSILLFSSDHPSKWRPEYAGYMVEGTPGKPYGGMMAHFNLVEANMKLR